MLARLLAAVSLAGLAAPAAAQTFAAEGDWQMREGEESCRAFRTYGEGEGRQILQFQSWGPGAPWQLVLLSPRLPDLDRRAQPVTVRQGEADSEAAGIFSEAGGTPLLTLQAAPPTRPHDGFARGWAKRPLPAAFGLDPRARQVTFSSQRMEPVTLETGSLAPMLSFLTTCERELAASWGFPEPPATPAELTNRERLTEQMFYPGALLLNRISTLVEFRFVVDEEGRARDCKVQSPPWEDSASENTCNAITNAARFTPARDADGNPVPSLYQASTIFVMDAD